MADYGDAIQSLRTTECEISSLVAKVRVAHQRIYSAVQVTICSSANRAPSNGLDDQTAYHIHMRKREARLRHPSTIGRQDMREGSRYPEILITESLRGQ